MLPVFPDQLLKDVELLKQKVRDSRLKATLSVNLHLLCIYWEVGNFIAIREAQRGWGAKVIPLLSVEFANAFPDMKGWSLRNLRYMKSFALAWPELGGMLSGAPDIESVAILQQPAAKLPWFHICVLLDKLKNVDERNFYARQAVENGWSRNILIHQIELNLYERHGKLQHNFTTSLPKHDSELAISLFKDSYKFDFLNGSGMLKEKDLEESLVNRMLRFILEMGKGFAFVGRQYKMVVGGKDFYIDLLFYHVKLHCYVAVELKIGDFKPEYAGKMNFYLSSLDGMEKQEGDNPSIGLILCKSKNKVIVEYAIKDINRPIGVAAYQLTTEIPLKLKEQLPSIASLEERFEAHLLPNQPDPIIRF